MQRWARDMRLVRMYTVCRLQCFTHVHLLDTMSLFVDCSNEIRNSKSSLPASGRPRQIVREGTGSTLLALPASKERARFGADPRAVLSTSLLRMSSRSLQRLASATSSSESHTDYYAQVELAVAAACHCCCSSLRAGLWLRPMREGLTKLTT